MRVRGRGFDSPHLQVLRKDNPVFLEPFSRVTVFFPLFLKGLHPFQIFLKHLSAPLILPIFPLFFPCLAPDSLFSPDQVRSSFGKLYP